MDDEKDPGIDPGPDAADDGERTHRDGASVTKLPTAKGTPLAEREQEPGEQQELDAEVFAVEEAGKTVTLKDLVRRGTPVEVRYKMTGRALGSSKAGLLDPYATSTLIIADCVVDDVRTQYIRDADQKIEKAIHYVDLKPRVALPALSEAGAVMISEAAKANAA